jgi:SAM-dependent methyltransferase
MDLDDRVRDALPVNQPYDGLLAEAYDVWLPPTGRYSDRDLFRDVIREGAGPALELGCGNGRLLVGYLTDGLTVEGVDSSAAILDICRFHAEAVGHEVTLHHADWTTLDLGRTYATIYNPAGSFALIDDDADARRALHAWRAHLAPGGRLVLGLGAPHPEAVSDWEWRVRRSATRAADGVTFMVHEALSLDQETLVANVLDRHEVWHADGTLQTTFMRRHRLQYRTQSQTVALLQECGFAEVSTAGTDAAFLAFASASS